MKRILATAAVLATIGAAAFAQTQLARNPAIDTQLEAQIEPVLNQFDEAWNRHDPVALASMFTDDAVLINPSGRQARGRAEIEQLFRDEQSTAMRETTFTHQLVDVRALTPTIVVVDEEITVTGALDPSGNPLPPMQVHGTMVMKKVGETWKVVDGRPYVFAQPPQLGVGGSGMEGTDESVPDIDEQDHADDPGDRATTPPPERGY
jgi:uncharacterized protein (TIGR02246 family)